MHNDYAKVIILNSVHDLISFSSVFRIKMLVKNIFCFICISLGLVTVSSKDPRRQIFEDALAVWDMYRDPYNGFYCDSLHFYPKPIAPCGPRNNFYSSAGTGKPEAILHKKEQ